MPDPASESRAAEGAGTSVVGLSKESASLTLSDMVERVRWGWGRRAGDPSEAKRDQGKKGARSSPRERWDSRQKTARDRTGGGSSQQDRAGW